MNASAMAQYIKFVADRLLVELGCSKVNYTVFVFSKKKYIYISFILDLSL
jgi:hypothetical protein